MDKPTTIQTNQLFDVREVVPARHVVEIAVDPHHNPIILSLESPPDYRTTSAQGASFVKLKSKRPNRFRIDYFRGGVWLSVTLEPTKENYHYVQPLGRECWLLVRGRAAGKSDKNAHVHGPEGKHIRSFHAGDAIAEVQTTENSNVWVSYFDQGVFGDTPLGKEGLVCLDDEGRVVFRFNDLAIAEEIPDIADCYALNVCSDRETWLYYYTEFPLVQIVDGNIAKIWTDIGSRGSKAFAVAEWQILFAGGYHKAEKLFLVDLDDPTNAIECVPVDLDGKALEPFTGFGRGSKLYLITGTSVFVVDLADR